MRLKKYNPFFCSTFKLILASIREWLRSSALEKTNLILNFCRKSPIKLGNKIKIENNYVWYN